MSIDVERLPGFETTASNWIHLVGVCIEIFGVFIIVAGIVWSTYLCVHRRRRRRTTINTRYGSAVPCCLASKYWSPPTS